MKKIATMVGTAMVGGMALAEDAGGFDPTTLLSDATSTVSEIAAAVSTVLVAAAAIYLAFIGWRKFREACNRI